MKLIHHNKSQNTEIQELQSEQESHPTESLKPDHPEEVQEKGNKIDTGPLPTADVSAILTSIGGLPPAVVAAILASKGAGVGAILASSGVGGPAIYLATLSKRR